VVFVSGVRSRCPRSVVCPLMFTSQFAVSRVMAESCSCHVSKVIVVEEEEEDICIDQKVHCMHASSSRCGAFEPATVS